jgi:hypothetical protein
MRAARLGRPPAADERVSLAAECSTLSKAAAAEQRGAVRDRNRAGWLVMRTGSLHVPLRELHHGQVPSAITPRRTLRLPLLVVCALLGAACTSSPVGSPSEHPPSRTSSARSSASSATPESSAELETVVVLPARPPLVDLKKLSVGDPAGVEYLEGTDMVLPTGRRVPLDTSNWSAAVTNFTGFARVGDRWLVGHFALGPYGSKQERGPYARLYNPGGGLAAEWEISGEVGGEARERRFAWARDAFVARTWVVSHEGLRTHVRGHAVGTAGSDLLVQRLRRDGYDRVRPDHDSVAVPVSVSPAIEEVALTGTAEHGLAPATFLLRPQAQRPDVGSADLQEGRVHGLYDLRTRRPALYSALPLDSLSTDGLHALTWRPVRRPATFEPLIVSTRTGEATSFGTFPGTAPHVFWEDAAHVLLSFTGRGRPSSSWLVRLGTGGMVERVAGPTAGRFVLPTRGMREQ